MYLLNLTSIQISKYTDKKFKNYVVFDKIIKSFTRFLPRPVSYFQKDFHDFIRPTLQKGCKDRPVGFLCSLKYFVVVKGEHESVEGVTKTEGLRSESRFIPLRR